MVVKMGRGLSVITRWSAFLTPHSKKQVLQVLVLPSLDYCPVVWSSAARKDLVKLQLAQNRAAHSALHCNQRADINTVHASFSWLKVEDRLTASLLFIRNINVLKIPNCLHSQLTHSSETHTYPTRHATRVFSQSPNPEQIQESVQYYIEPFAWNFLLSHTAQINSKPGIKNRQSNTSWYNASPLFDLDSLCVCIDM